MTKFIHLYVIFRVDFFKLDGGEFTKERADHAVTIKRVFRSAEEAEEEVERLNALTHDKDCFYYWQRAKADPSFFR